MASSSHVLPPEGVSSNTRSTSTSRIISQSDTDNVSNPSITQNDTNSTQNDNSKVIRLNVGGTHYEVSRSLIEIYPDTMLARLISKEWNSSNDNDKNQEIFIDRDGPRFQYVLDYMRDQKVLLAVNVLKQSIVTELEYFGFVNIPLESINEQTANKRVLQHVEQTTLNFTKRLAKKQKIIQKSGEDWLLTKVASLVYEAKLCSKSHVDIPKKDLQLCPQAEQLFGRKDYIMTAVNVILSEFGLSIVNVINFGNFYRVMVGFNPAA
jgi:BTB/POZ domain